LPPHYQQQQQQQHHHHQQKQQQLPAPSSHTHSLVALLQQVGVCGRGVVWVRVWVWA
jgi:hypothetical protein